jgi:hypothetical protein
MVSFRYCNKSKPKQDQKKNRGKNISCYRFFPQILMKKVLRASLGSDNGGNLPMFKMFS